MRGKKCFVVMLALVWMVAPVLALEAPAGWQKQAQDGFTVFTPPNLGSRYFSVMLSEPLPLEGKSLENWGESISTTLSASFGTPGTRGTPESSPQLWTVTHEVNAQGKQLAVVYHVFAVAQDRARFSVMVGEPELFSSHLETGGQLIAAAMAESRGTASGTTSPATADNAAKPEDSGASSRQADGAGSLPFQASAVEAILNHSRTSYDVWGLKVIDTSHVLLKDGRLYSNGKAAGRWRRAGSGYEFEAGEGWKALEGEPVKAVSSSDLTGLFSADRASAFGTTSSVSRNRIRFHSDGRYEISAYQTGHSSLGTGLGDSNVTAGNIASGNTGTHSNTFSDGKNEQGQYRLIGRNIIELRSNNGQTRQLLAYYTDDKREWLNLNEVSYKRQ